MEKVDWIFCQNNSDKILSDGILKLCNSDMLFPQNVGYSSFGNYLISHLDQLYYIGEGQDIYCRIRQQFKPTTSTFYKNFLKMSDTNQILPIDAFKVRIMPTNIGRKEIEEFGIVNLSTSLNKFQLGKRIKLSLENSTGLWDKVQQQKMELLKQAEQYLLKINFTSWFDCNVESTAGLYIVKYQNELIYIGESSNIKERHATHSTTTYFSALRRNIGRQLFSYELQERNGKKKYFADNHDKEVTNFLKKTSATFYPVTFGRYELEEYLIKKHKPILNRKGNLNTISH